MQYKPFALMNIAVIGDGPVIESIARKLAKSPYNIYIGTKSEHALLSDDLFEKHFNVFHATIEYAAASADLIILATPADEVREASYLLDDVRNKVIIDMSGLFYSRFGNYINTLNAINAITYSPYVVKCYSSGGVDSVINLFNRRNYSTMYYAGDSKKAKEMLKLVSRDLGFEDFYDFGYSKDILELDRVAMKEEFVGVSQR